MFTGREVLKIQNMEYRKKGKLGIRNLGSLVLFEGGLAFFKSRGALAASVGFGLVGQFFSRNNEKNEAQVEIPFTQIASVKLRSVYLMPAIEVALRDGSSVLFITQSRVFNGKSDLKKAVYYISAQIR